MANPIISTLRRNQTYVLAVMGVVLIITWVIGPQIIPFIQQLSSGPTSKPAVMNWSKGGSTVALTEGDITQLRQEHSAVLSFVKEVVRTGDFEAVLSWAIGLEVF